MIAKLRYREKSAIRPVNPSPVIQRLFTTGASIMWVKIAVGFVGGVLAFVALPVIFERGKSDPPPPYIPPPCRLPDSEFGLLSGSSNSIQGVYWFGSIYNGSRWATVGKVVLRVETDNWTRDFQIIVKATPLSSAPFTIDLGEFNVRIKRWWLIDALDR
jgi:hypothetical protein